MRLIFLAIGQHYQTLYGFLSSQGSALRLTLARSNDRRMPCVQLQRAEAAGLVNLPKSQTLRAGQEDRLR